MSMRINSNKMQEILNTGCIVVYVDPDFCWKDLVYKSLDGNSAFVLISDSEEIELYRMYEFSDRFIALIESDEYGSIWNYVKRGVISAEDALSCILN